MTQQKIFRKKKYFIRNAVGLIKKMPKRHNKTYYEYDVKINECMDAKKRRNKTTIPTDRSGPITLIKLQTQGCIWKMNASKETCFIFPWIMHERVVINYIVSFMINKICNTNQSILNSLRQNHIDKKFAQFAAPHKCN